MRITTLLFDADGVIQRASPDFQDRIAGFLGARANERERFLDAIFLAEGPCVTGDRDFAHELGALLEEWQLDIAVADVLRAWEAIHPLEGFDTLVRRLRASNYLCCLATNQQQYRSRHMRTALGYDALFDEQFYSCDMGLRKPNPAYFRHILACLGRAPEEVLFVDDNAGNIAAAAQCAIPGLLFDQQQHAEPLRVLTERLEAFGVCI